MDKLSTENYKGVRDFYPEDQFIENYIFKTWQKVLTSFGYLEYNASPLEPAELFEAKSGEEIVNEQTYTFEDRGGRRVTLRPEMTPTAARMVAKKSKELSKPIRFFSIPNVFRYEQPQKGRLREHFQLNVDLFGGNIGDANLEMLLIASSLMRAFGAKDDDFEIHINDRRIMDTLFETLEANDEQKHKLSKIIDKKDKISEDAFAKAVEETLPARANDLIRALQSSQQLIETIGENHQPVKELFSFVDKLEELDFSNVIFSPTLMRGFDYYTGFIFEVFDTNKENRRSLFGGGRFDKLLGIFGAEEVPAVGFGMGDVTTRDFLEVHNLLPEYKHPTKLYLAVASKSARDYANALALGLREGGISTIVDISDKKVGDQIKFADKNKIPFVAVIGEDEEQSHVIKVKELSSGVETDLEDTHIASFLKRR